MELTGKVAVVTGGGSGIGRALALRIARDAPAGVVVADVNAGAAEAVAAEIGPRAIGVACDVTDEAGLRALLARTEHAFGPVDAFFANAGVASRRRRADARRRLGPGLRRQRARPRHCGAAARAGLAGARARAASSSPRRPRDC